MRHKQRFSPPPGYTPKFYGYARVSHRNQAEDGGSVAEQDARIRAYFEIVKLGGTFEWGGVYAEPQAQSAYKKPFPQRPAGKDLHDLLRPGDHLCVDKFDRIFRDLEDFACRRRYFQERGIKFHIVNFFGSALDVDSLVGQVVLPMLAIFAEIESVQKSERIRAKFSAQRAAGRQPLKQVPFFCRHIKNEAGKIIAIEFQDWYEKVAERVAYLYDVEQLGFRRIAKILVKDKFNLDMRRVRNFYAFYKHWLEVGKPDVNTLKISDFIDQWWEKHPAPPSPRKREDPNNPFSRALEPLNP